MALQKEMGAQGIGIELPNQGGPPQFTQAMIDQNIAQIQREQMMQQQNYLNQMAALNAQQNAQGQGDFYKVQKVQEEIQTKANLDYENRLRGHMYQFEEGDQTMVSQNQNTSHLSKGVPSVGSGKKAAHPGTKPEEAGPNRNISISKDTENML